MALPVDTVTKNLKLLFGAVCNNLKVPLCLENAVCNLTQPSLQSKAQKHGLLAGSRPKVCLQRLAQ